MANLLNQDDIYKAWLSEIKAKIQTSQIKAALAVNTTLINLYWDLGRMLVQKQQESNWGDGLIKQLAKDLKSAFPEVKGFSISNLKYCRQFFLFYAETPVIRQQAVAYLPDEKSQQAVGQLTDEKVQQLVGQIPWGHNILIFTKIKDQTEALFYIRETIANNWSRNVLALQLKSDLYRRQGKAISNFERVLPAPQSDLAIQTLQDPYIFDFLQLDKKAREAEIESKLVQNITQFLLALGKGFAFLGKQYELRIAGKEYFLDLLFYHTKLHCYVVIELKTGEFKPEYAGKLNFYLSAVDDLLKTEADKPAIGILLCRDKNKIEVEYALRDINKPIGVSEFEFTEILPENLKSDLPTIEELEQDLNSADAPK